MMTHRLARRRSARQRFRRIVRSRRADRRGVLILVVLSLLVLFLLIGVAFVLTSGQFHSSSRAASHMDRVGTSSRVLLDDAMYQLLRDTTNPRSVIRSHSLLRDMYGDDGWKGNVASAVVTPGSNDQMLPGLNAQMLDLSMALNPSGWNINTPFTSSPVALSLSPTTGAYAGCLLTIVSGPVQGMSMRIVDYQPQASPNGAVFRVLTINGNVDPATLAGVRYVVNGWPFNGTGAGFVPSTTAGQLGRCSAFETATQSAQNYPTQLLPNRRTDGINLLPAYMNGGLDESYDAPDANNMFLGAVYTYNNPANAMDPLNGKVIPYTAANAGTIIPSFHRRALLEWYETTRVINIAPNTGRVERNRWNLRPSRPEEMDFYADIPTALGAGSSKESVRLLDVDNDGDGINDSVWLDLGYPVQIGPNGTLVKPMFAFLCLDLDGRINVNAAGNRWHYLTPTTTDQTLAGAVVTTATMLAGQGLGPAEINLHSFLTTYGGVSSQLLLEGISGGWPGRYGVTPPSFPVNTPPAPGIQGFDVLSVAKFYDYPANSFTPGARGLRGFGTPADLHGRLGFGLGARGQLLYDQLVAADDDLTDNPYEINLNNQGLMRGSERTNQFDMLFSPGELERVLRFADTDASGLPSRLWDLLGPSVTSSAYAALVRRSVTTDSFDLPVPAVLPTPDFQAEYVSGPSQMSPVSHPPLPFHITGLLRGKLRANGVGVTPVDESLINAQIRLMLSPDLMRGTRMDLNRPFGNALDDNTDGQADEPLEATDLWYYGVPGSTPASVAFDHTSAGATVNNNIQAKQAFARHLYVLAMTLLDKNQFIDFDGNSANNSANETARGLAQWAINVVDFRDADSIMSPFEFDLNPFNGWNVDGDISSASTDNDIIANPDRGLVWGCERPELLFTETMAFHNRNTTDTNTAGVGDEFSTSHTSTPGNDTTFDQERMPQGTFMVELYNPWLGNTAFPTELYSNSGVHLNRMSGTTATPGTSPVWRILIVSGASKGRDPDDPVPANQLAAGDVERSIYFVQPPGTTLGEDGTSYYPSATVSGLFPGTAPNNVISVPPGSYAVVGSSGTLTGANYDSPIGQRIDGMAAGQRTIRLTPPTMTATQLVVGNAASPADPVPPSPVVVVPIDTPRSMSISEPVDGYNTTGSTLAGGILTPPIAIPLDNGDTTLMANATVANHRTIYLQRLANPMLDYNAETNPYLTIDMMPVNLTTFNGATNDPEPGMNPQNNAEPSNFASVERGNNSDTATAYNLWRQEPLAGSLRSSVAGTTNDHFFNMVLKHSLGYLSSTFGPTPSAAVGDTGAPVQPFPFLNWNNRPYSSQYELMQVPFARSSRLAIDYPAIQGSFANPYSTNTGWFANRLNFFLPSTFPPTGAPTKKPELYRLLDYTHVPSRFLGTEYELSPTEFQDVPGFQPPFHHVSAYREPGKVNINTIYNEAEWLAILDGHAGPTFTQLVESRRGFTPTVAAPGNTVGPNGAFPTLMANPFRSADANVMVPTAPSPTSPTTILEKPNPIDVTLLRVGPTAGIPLFPPPTAGLYNTPTRNSKFAYEGFEHIANLVTTRSNVFAVWITIGYFEVNYVKTPGPTIGAPTTFQQIPTGPFMLGREADSDIGGAKRNRAFYIIDRSIPVAFEPGQNNNVDNAVILRRFIE